MKGFIKRELLVINYTSRFKRILPKLRLNVIWNRSNTQSEGSTSTNLTIENGGDVEIIGPPDSEDSRNI